MEKKKKKPVEVVRFGVSMPKTLLMVLDKLAEQEGNTRSKMIQILIKNTRN